MSATAGLLLDADARARLREGLEQAGFVSFGPPALDPQQFQALCEDARRQQPGGWGQPSRPSIAHRVWRADLGENSRSFLDGDAVRGLLEALVGEPVVLSAAGTCFTYYQGPGDYMDTHLDRAIDCTYTFIVYLEADWPGFRPPGEGMALQVWNRGPLPQDGVPPDHRLPSRANTIAVGRGSQVPHRRPPLAKGERLVALTACYAPAALGRQRGQVEPQPERAAELAQEGDRYWGMGQRRQARACYEQALDVYPGYDQAWSGLGYVYWEQGRFVEAQEAFTRGARCNGDAASHWSNIGLCLRDQQAFEPAIRCFQVALRLDPRYAPALNEWANVLQDQGRPQEALGLYARALAIDPTRAVVYHNLGVAYRRLGYRERAESAFLDALERDPDYHHSLEELALLHAETGRADSARSLLEQAGSRRAMELLGKIQTVNVR